jgi:hypothetical protein
LVNLLPSLVAEFSDGLAISHNSRAMIFPQKVFWQRIMRKSVGCVIRPLAERAIYRVQDSR